MFLSFADPPLPPPFSFLRRAPSRSSCSACCARALPSATTTRGCEGSGEGGCAFFFASLFFTPCAFRLTNTQNTTETARRLSHLSPVCKTPPLSMHPTPPPTASAVARSAADAAALLRGDDGCGGRAGVSGQRDGTAGRSFDLLVTVCGWREEREGREPRRQCRDAPCPTAPSPLSSPPPPLPHRSPPSPTLRSRDCPACSTVRGGERERGGGWRVAAARTHIGGRRAPPTRPPTLHPGSLPPPPQTGAPPPPHHHRRPARRRPGAGPAGRGAGRRRQHARPGAVRDRGARVGAHARPPLLLAGGPAQHRRL